MKKCSKCKEYKELSSFGVKKYNKDGLNHYCKECESQRGKIKYQNPITREGFKYRQIFRFYGLTKNDYLNKLTTQNNSCAICSTPLLNDRNTHIDHNHKTGVIRDILCHNCNFIIGVLESAVLPLENYTNYLMKYGGVSE